MQPHLIEIKKALEEYFEAVASLKTQTPKDIRPPTFKLVELEKQYLHKCDPRLKHFLEGKSYRKAFDWICSQE